MRSYDSEYTYAYWCLSKDGSAKKLNIQKRYLAIGEDTLYKDAAGNLRLGSTFTDADEKLLDQADGIDVGGAYIDHSKFVENRLNVRLYKGGVWQDACWVVTDEGLGDRLNITHWCGVCKNGVLYEDDKGDLRFGKLAETDQTVCKKGTFEEDRPRIGSLSDYGDDYYYDYYFTSGEEEEDGTPYIRLDGWDAKTGNNIWRILPNGTAEDMRVSSVVKGTESAAFYFDPEGTFCFGSLADTSKRQKLAEAGEFEHASLWHVFGDIKNMAVESYQYSETSSVWKYWIYDGEAVKCVTVPNSVSGHGLSDYGVVYVAEHGRVARVGTAFSDEDMTLATLEDGESGSLDPRWVAGPYFTVDYNDGSSSSAQIVRIKGSSVEQVGSGRKVTGAAESTGLDGERYHYVVLDNKVFAVNAADNQCYTLTFEKRPSHSFGSYYANLDDNFAQLAFDNDASHKLVKLSKGTQYQECKVTGAREDSYTENGITVRYYVVSISTAVYGQKLKLYTKRPPSEWDSMSLDDFSTERPKSADLSVKEVVEAGSMGDGTKIYGSKTWSATQGTHWVAGDKDGKAITIAGKYTPAYSSCADETLLGGSGVVQRPDNGLTYVKDAANGKYGALWADGSVAVEAKYDSIFDAGLSGATSILVKEEGAWKYLSMPTKPVSKNVGVVKGEGVSAVSVDGVAVADGGLQVQVGKTVKLVCEFEQGYRLAGISVKQGDVDVALSEDGTFTMPEGDVTVTVAAAKLYGVSVNTGIENGSVSVVGGVEAYAAGETVTLEATPGEGYTLDTIAASYGNGQEELELADGETIGRKTFTMPADNVTVTATFKKADVSYTVSFVSGTGVEQVEIAGVAAVDGVVKLAAGVTATVSYQFAKGYELDSISVKQGDIDIQVVQGQFVMPEGDVTVTVTAKGQYKAAGTIGGGVEGGSIAFSKSEGLAPGESVDVTVIAPKSTEANGYEIDAFSLKSNQEDVKYTVKDDKTSVVVYNFIMPAGDVEASVSFKEKTGLDTGETQAVADEDGSSADYTATSEAGEDAAGAVTYDAYNGVADDSGENVAVTIPDTVTINGREFAVTAIAADAFKGSNVSKVEVGAQVTTIGANAFENASKLKEVVIGAAVTNIGAKAFSGCGALTAVSVPAKVSAIGADAFQGCKSMTNVTFGAAVATIGANAFSGCSALRSIAVPAKVTVVNNGTFRNCTSLASATLGAGVTSIGANAFSGCSKLGKIAVPAKVKAVGASAFQGCSSMTSATLGASVTSIGANAFSGCGKLGKVSVPAKVGSIGAGAFQGCKTMKSATLGKSVKTIGKNAFKGDSKLKSIKISSKKLTAKSVGAGAFSGIAAKATVKVPKAKVKSYTKIFKKKGLPKKAKVKK